MVALPANIFGSSVSGRDCRKRSIWKFSLVAQIVSAAEPTYILSIVVRLVLPFGVAALWAWITERRVLRSADAASADSVTVS